MSGRVYIVNDYADREADRNHPVKNTDRWPRELFLLSWLLDLARAADSFAGHILFAQSAVYRIIGALFCHERSLFLPAEACCHH